MYFVAISVAFPPQLRGLPEGWELELASVTEKMVIAARRSGNDVRRHMSRASMNVINTPRGEILACEDFLVECKSLLTSKVVNHELLSKDKGNYDKRYRWENGSISHVQFA